MPSEPLHGAFGWMWIKQMKLFSGLQQSWSTGLNVCPGVVRTHQSSETLGYKQASKGDSQLLSLQQHLYKQLCKFTDKPTV